MIVTAGTVRRRAEAVLREQLPLVLPVLAVQENVALPGPRTWNRLSDFVAITESQSPAVVVTTPGLESEPARRGDSTDAPWLVRVFVVVRGQSYEQTADRLAAYVAACRVGLYARPSLGGLAKGCQWVSESYSELDADNTRTVGAGSVLLRYLQVATDMHVPALNPPVTSSSVTVSAKE